MKRGYACAMEDEAGCTTARGGSVMDVDAAAPAHSCAAQERLTHRKRACGRASVGAMAGHEVAAQAARLGLQLPADVAAGGASSQQWAALAELNALVAAHPGEIGGNSHSFHSVSRTSRYALWARYDGQHGVGAEAAYAAAAGGGGGGRRPLPGLLGMVLHVIGSCLAPYPDASCVEYEVNMPNWLLAWASRWGLSHCGARIKLLHIEAFADDGSGSVGAARPAHSLYLPMLPGRA